MSTLASSFRRIQNSSLWPSLLIRDEAVNWTSAWNGWLPETECLPLFILFCVVMWVPKMLFGIAYPFAHFAIHGQQSALSLTLFGCMLAALGVALVLVPRMVMVSYVNCLMEPAFRHILTLSRTHTARERAVWTLEEARRCVAAYYVVPICVALPLAIGVQVLPPDVVTTCIAPYMDFTNTSVADVDEWRIRLAHA